MSEESPKYGDPLFGPGVDPVAARVKGWHVESGHDQLDLIVKFFGGQSLTLRAAMGEQVFVAVRSKEGPSDVARQITHALGMTPLLTDDELDDLIGLVADTATADAEWHPIVNKLRAYRRARA